ncbi:NAD(P)H-dependent oxidoreductase [Limobrevibacterium gyesilva]|uniref:SAF domain-containing protein n=1 Tax=Limobrevibacterium gyesilva TaxID=2991712 RepID=A0AA42CF34_9PROT|nr:SAF domain-containing protein [Limobrevibacterium gyesilva]MCW3476778.1 SAF domain-containing protein [Limobrevibacterium gyesilva]
MNLATMLAARAESGRPIRIGLIGAGKFGTMFLAQLRRTAGMHLVAIADLAPARARANLAACGWPAERYAAGSFAEAWQHGTTFVTDDAPSVLAHDGIEMVVEATGDPAAGIRHCLGAIASGKHIVMVNVEADALAGPLLARRARAAGVIYSLAYGDQPALICEHVDWARTCGFEVVAAGKGTRYRPAFHRSTPDTVWENFGLTPEKAARGGMNPKMFNSFIDGSKSGIEMTAVCNATGLTPQPNGLAFPPASCTDLARVCKPAARGGTLTHKGTVEVVSSLNRDGTPVANDLQMGTYVVVEAGHPYVRHCAEEYRMLPDDSFEHMALYRPIHMIGLEIGISVASIALRGEPTGAPNGFRADVVATAKRPLAAGEVLDGEGGYCVWGRQMPADRSLALGCLPLGLAHRVTLKNPIAEGQVVRWRDVAIDESDPGVRIRREMEAVFARPDALPA